MSDALKKALGLPTTATEAEMLKALEDKEKKLKAAEDKVEKMSDKHSAFMAHKDAKMPKGGKEAFQSMSAAERDKHISDNPIEEESEDEVEKAIKAGSAFRTVDGNHLIVKAKVGAEQFAILKSMDEGRRSDRKKIADNEDEKVEKAFENQAVDLGFAKAFAPTLRKAFNGDTEAQALLAKEIKALRVIAEKSPLFKELGGGSGTGGTAASELVAKAQELQKAQPTLTYEQAYSRVYKDRGNAEIVKRYRQEAAGTA